MMPLLYGFEWGIKIKRPCLYCVFNSLYAENIIRRLPRLDLFKLHNNVRNVHFANQEAGLLVDSVLSLCIYDKTELYPLPFITGEFFI